MARERLLLAGIALHDGAGHGRPAGSQCGNKIRLPLSLGGAAWSWVNTTHSGLFASNSSAAGRRKSRAGRRMNHDERLNPRSSRSRREVGQPQPQPLSGLSLAALVARSAARAAGQDESSPRTERARAPRYLNAAAAAKVPNAGARGTLAVGISARRREVGARITRRAARARGRRRRLRETGRHRRYTALGAAAKIGIRRDYSAHRRTEKTMHAAAR